MAYMPMNKIYYAKTEDDAKAPTTISSRITRQNRRIGDGHEVCEEVVISKLFILPFAFNFKRKK